MLIDTHCHLDFQRFDEDRDEVIARAENKDVRVVIVPAVDLQNCPNVLQLAEAYPGVFAAVGVHPNSTSEWQPAWIELVKEMAEAEKVVAIGEIGLDYYWDHSPREVQHVAFSSQLALAAELDLPAIIHNRESGEDVIRLLAESPLAGRERPGVLHSFSDQLSVARAALEMGFYIGITGPVTFKKADDLRRIVAQLPLDRLLVETDAPFLAPQQFRGKRNEPAFVSFVVEQIALLHGLSSEETGDITTANARRLFGSRLSDSRQSSA
jgi:TatD DNase family protein